MPYSNIPIEEDQQAWFRSGSKEVGPGYSNIVDYPDSMTIGDTLFPMLYIYYMGNDSNRSKIGNEYKFEEGLTNYITLLGDVAGLDASKKEQSKTTLMRLAKKFYLMFSSAWERNPQWVWSLSNAAASAMTKYSSRLSYNPNRPLPGSKYYRQQMPNGNVKFSSLPQINGNTGADIDTCMEAFRILYENGLIAYDYDIGIRPINIYTAELAQEREDIVMDKVGAKYIGLPTRGVFTVNKTKKGSTMYHTFSGTDIIALASLDTTVSELNQLLSFSWSIHRGATSNRTLGKPSAGGRIKGGRTIAGSMVFAMTDHHPLRDVIPDDWEGRKTQILNDPDTWKPLVMADEIPPFDIVFVLMNEYGNASITTLYGVQVVDEGGVMGMDNLITENVIQYTAVAMDPVTEASIGDDGLIDPYGILQGGYSKMWRRRELMAAGAGFSDLEKAYENYYDSVFDTIDSYRKSGILDEIDRRQTLDSR